MRRSMIAAFLLTAGLTCESHGVLTLAPVNPHRNGTYWTTVWKYTYEIQAQGTRSEARYGILTFENVEMEKLLKAKVHDRFQTPWGMMQYFGAERPPFGCGGWLLKRTYDEPLLPEGKLLGPPKPGAGERYWKEPLEVTMTKGDETVECALGQLITVRLPSEVGSSLAWRVVNVTGDAVSQQGTMGLAHADTPAGPRNTYFATFKALKAGRATATFEYRKPKEKEPPAKIVCVTFVAKIMENKGEEDSAKENSEDPGTRPHSATP